LTSIETGKKVRPYVIETGSREEGPIEEKKGRGGGVFEPSRESLNEDRHPLK